MVVLYDLQVSTPLFFIVSMSCVSFEEESMFVCLFVCLRTNASFFGELHIYLRKLHLHADARVMYFYSFI